MEETSLKITGANKSFMNKISNTISKLLIPTKIGINGMFISVKRNSMLKAFEHFNSVEEKDAYEKKYEDNYVAYLESLDKYVMDSTELSSRIDQLNQVASVTLEAPKRSPYKDLEVYYYIETEADGIILDVEISGKGRTMFVNGMEVEYDPAFYELVEPYLDAYIMELVPEEDSWSSEGG